jgi:hypothetical protein
MIPRRKFYDIGVGVFVGSWDARDDDKALDARTAAVLALGEEYLAAAKRIQQRPPVNERFEPVNEQLIFAALAADVEAER